MNAIGIPLYIGQRVKALDTGDVYRIRSLNRDGTVTAEHVNSGYGIFTRKEIRALRGNEM